MRLKLSKYLMSYEAPFYYLSYIFLYQKLIFDIKKSIFLYQKYFLTNIYYLFPLPCGTGSTVPREGFDSSVIMLFSWCVVAVTLPI